MPERTDDQAGANRGSHGMSEGREVEVGATFKLEGGRRFLYGGGKRVRGDNHKESKNGTTAFRNSFTLIPSQTDIPSKARFSR